MSARQARRFPVVLDASIDLFTQRRMPDITILIRENGPYKISAEDAVHLRLTDHLGNPIPLPEGKSVALCRCGGSSTKPFCDGQHSKIGFLGAIAAVQEAERAVQATPVTGETAPA